MKQKNGIRCAEIILALAVLSGCGSNTAVTGTKTETSAVTSATTETTTAAPASAATTAQKETTPETTKEATTTETTTTEATTMEATSAEETAAAPVREDYDRSGHGIDVIGCEYKELEYSTDLDDTDDEKSRIIDDFLRMYVPPEGFEDTAFAFGYCGVMFGGYISYDFDCDGKDEYIISMPYTNVMGESLSSCILYYIEDDGNCHLLHGAAYPMIDLWDFGGLVLFEVHPDWSNGIYGGDSQILRAYDGESPAFVFSSHGDDTRFVEESGYFFDYAGHMYGPYYAVVTPEREFLWITRDDLTADELMECAQTDTYITDWLEEQGMTAESVLEAYTVGHLSYCVLVKSEDEREQWYTLTPDGSWGGTQSYISEDGEHFVGELPKTIHGVDLRKLNIV